MKNFFSLGRKKKDEKDENAVREELFRATAKPKAAPAPTPTSSSSSYPSSNVPSSAPLSSSRTSSSTTMAPQSSSSSLSAAPRTYASQQEHYDALVAERRAVDQAALESTRRSVNRIAEAEMLASGNLSKLATQGG